MKRGGEWAPFFLIFKTNWKVHQNKDMQSKELVIFVVSFSLCLCLSLCLSFIFCGYEWCCQKLTCIDIHVYSFPLHFLSLSCPLSLLFLSLSYFLPSLSISLSFSFFPPSLSLSLFFSLSPPRFKTAFLSYFTFSLSLLHFYFLYFIFLPYL